MVKKLVSRSEFAAMAGVSAAAVTKACNSALKAACSGKKIDPAHAAAVKYLEKQSRARGDGMPPGIDPDYATAVERCRELGRYGQATIRKVLGCGGPRAAQIQAQMKAAGIGPGEKPPKKPHVRGTAARKMQKQNASLAEAARQVREDSYADDNNGLVEIPEDIKLFLNFTLRELITRFGTAVAFSEWLAATQKIEMINEKRLKNARTEGELISRDVVKRGVLDPLDAVFVRMLTDGAKTIAGRAHAIAKAGGSVGEVQALIEDQLGSFIKPAKVKMSRAIRDA